MSQYIAVEEALRRLGCHRRTMRNMLYSGKLKWRWRGGRVEVELESVQQQLERERTPGVVRRVIPDDLDLAG